MEDLNFGKKVKIRLLLLGKTQEQLCKEVTERTGLFCDSSLLSKIYRGVLPGTKIRNAVCEILDMPEDMVKS